MFIRITVRSSVRALCFLFFILVSFLQNRNYSKIVTHIFNSIIKYEILNEHRQNSNCEFVAYDLFIVINSVTGQWT